MNKLLIAALAFSVLGITALYFYTNSLTAQPIEISTISGDMIGRSIRIDGFVYSKFISENNNTFLTIDDGTGKIIAVFFKPLATEQFDDVEILGTISERDGKPYTIEFVGMETTNAQIKVNGIQSSYVEGLRYSIGNPAISIYVKNITLLSTTDQTQNSVIISVRDFCPTTTTSCPAQRTLTLLYKNVVIVGGKLSILGREIRIK